MRVSVDKHKLKLKLARKLNSKYKFLSPQWAKHAESIKRKHVKKQEESHKRALERKENEKGKNNKP